MRYKTLTALLVDTYFQVMGKVNRKGNFTVPCEKMTEWMTAQEVIGLWGGHGQHDP